ncbi:hypothetical protein AB0912_00720 [Streptomyces sp. NPDC007084]|uniref:hypothetical protein n=1 Tax=Streptomyces sp. NPDC007084 TaxID=3154313 RepID=UPI0034567587
MTLMSPAPRHPHPLRRRGRARGGARWSARTLRVLVLLVVALLATGPHPETFTTPVAGVAALAGGTEGSAEGTAEHDALDTALRPPHRQAHRPFAPPHPAPPPLPGHPPRTARAAAPTVIAPVPSPALHTLRCVVLRC